MKKYYSLSVFTLIISAMIIAGCEGFLDEENNQKVSLGTASQHEETLDQLVAAVYERSREYTTRYTSDMYYTLEDLGTDIVTRGSSITGTSAINDYVNMNASDWVFEVYWANQYGIISAANVVLANADELNVSSEAYKATRLGEVKFFRAMAYFNLVENFGDVPLVLNQITSAVKTFTRDAEQDVYGQVVQDLEDALSAVDESPDDYGRVSKGAVRHLLSKVLLTRGYKGFAESTDFSRAAQLAETVITNYPLVSSFADLVDISGQRSSEVIFSYLFGDNSVSIGWGNSRHMLYKFRYFDYPGMTRGDNYQKGLGPAPTPFFYSLFEDGDERADATYRRVIYAEADSDDGTILAGDTAIYFPKSAWTQAQIDAVPYVVINPDGYFTTDGTTEVHYPMFKKFDNPGVPFTQPDQRSLGTRDMIMMRSGEAYLIAAEAYLQSGDAATAAARLSTLRARAGLVNPVSSVDVDLDFILDERARELVGEVNRWADLKRTGKLIERTLAHNPHAASNNALKPSHLLRPIPQRERDVTNGSLTQNPDYN